MKIRIIKASRPNYWYAKFIGFEMEAKIINEGDATVNMADFVAANPIDAKSLSAWPGSIGCIDKADFEQLMYRIRIFDTATNPTYADLAGMEFDVSGEANNNLCVYVFHPTKKKQVVIDSRDYMIVNKNRFISGDYIKTGKIEKNKSRLFLTDEIKYGLPSVKLVDLDGEEIDVDGPIFQDVLKFYGEIKKGEKYVGCLIKAKGPSEEKLKDFWKFKDEFIKSIGLENTTLSVTLFWEGDSLNPLPKKERKPVGIVSGGEHAGKVYYSDGTVEENKTLAEEMFKNRDTISGPMEFKQEIDTKEYKAWYDKEFTLLKARIEEIKELLPESTARQQLIYDQVNPFLSESCIRLEAILKTTIPAFEYGKHKEFIKTEAYTGLWSPSKVYTKGQIFLKEGVFYKTIEDYATGDSKRKSFARLPGAHTPGGYAFSKDELKANPIAEEILKARKEAERVFFIDGMAEMTFKDGLIVATGRIFPRDYLYVGGWRAGNTYKKADVVQYLGTYYFCEINRIKNDDSPDMGSGWRQVASSFVPAANKTFTEPNIQSNENWLKERLQTRQKQLKKAIAIYARAGRATPDHLKNELNAIEVQLIEDKPKSNG